MAEKLALPILSVKRKSTLFFWRKLQNFAMVPAVPVPPEQIPPARFDSNVGELLLSRTARMSRSVPAVRSIVPEESVVEPFMSDNGVAVPAGTEKQLPTGAQLFEVVEIFVPLTLRVRVCDCPLDEESPLQNLMFATPEDVPVLPPLLPLEPPLPLLPPVPVPLPFFKHLVPEQSTV
jgi:hypothetical protein